MTQPRFDLFRLQKNYFGTRYVGALWVSAGRV